VRGVVPPGTFAVVLTVPDESALLQLQQRLVDSGVDHTLIRENDPPYAGQATALGAAPALRRACKRYFSALPLLGSDKEV